MGREQLMDCLTEKGIQSRPVWYLNHLQLPYRKDQAYKIEKAFKFWECVLNIPCSTNLTAKEVQYIVSTIRKFANNEQK